MVERAYKYRFYPTPEQESILRRTMGCVRLVYNKALDARTSAWYDRQERIGYSQTSSLLTQWKKQEELQFLNEVSCVPLQQGLRHLQKAFTNFFAKRTGYPCFKKKRNGGSAEFTKSAFKFKDGQLWLAKCKEPLNLRWSRDLPGSATPSTITVKLDASGRWFVLLLVNDKTVNQLPKTSNSVGIDVGINSLITTSEGEKVSNPRHFKSLYQKLRRAQKSLSRKTKGSNNYKKARLQVAKIHAKIKDARTDFLHQLTTDLVRRYDLIAIEDLAIKNMVKNRKLAQAISDVAWGELIRQLDYKCQWYEKQLVKIDRFFPSSKRCGNCGQTVVKLPLSVRQWECPSCGSQHDRDINASKNLEAAGLAVLACGASVRPEGSKSRKATAKKQEPKS